MKEMTVNGEAIDPKALEAERKNLSENYLRVIPEGEREGLEGRIERDAIDNVIDRMLLSQAAERASISVPEQEVKKRLKRMMKEHGGEDAFFRATGLDRATLPLIRKDVRKQLQFERYIDRLVGEVKPAPEEDCRAFYERSKKGYRVPEMVRASHIVLQPNQGRTVADVYADLLNVRVALVDGADFGEVARLVSDNAENDGDLGFFPRGRMVDGFDEVVFEMDVGEISDVIHTEFGYHLVKVTDRRPARDMQYEEVRKKIRDELTEAAKNRRIGKEADRLRSEATLVGVDED